MKEEEIHTKGKKKRVSVINIFLAVAFLAGLGIMLYPTVSDWWNERHATRAIANYVEAVASIDPEVKEAMLEDARAYNETLSPGINFMDNTDSRYAEYESLLDLTGTGIMGYIQIPSINVNLPIYHGTEDHVLQVAIGHIAGSSLPVGGESTHCVLSGHRGLPTARLFTDLDQMEPGNIFTVTVLDETITYEVDQIRIVLPEETGDLGIIEGEDHCTLVTCTPYGINTHRMLVRGKRIENIAGTVTVTAEAVRIPTIIVIPAVGIPLLFILLLIMLIYYRRKAPRRSDQELLDALRSKGDDDNPET